MTWQPPELSHLLDKRLQTARLELMQDSRILRAQDGQGTETIAFLRSLIEEKLTAATRSGLGAIEASLRTSAAAHLAQHGCGSSEIRTGLDEAGDPLINLTGLPQHGFATEIQRPIQSAALFYLAWIATITIGWLMSDSNHHVYLPLALGGTVIAIAIFLYTYGGNQKRRRALVHHYPGRLCKDYLGHLSAVTAQYAIHVNNLK